MKKASQQGQWYQIKALANNKLEVRLFGEIGWDVYASEFIRELDQHSKDAELDIRINSVGGSVFEGLHIYNRLKMHAGDITCTIEGLAASMASVIACAGDVIEVLPMSLVMIHNPATGAWGDQNDLNKAAETLGKIKEVLIDAYEPRLKIGRDEIAALMDAETWYTADEAVAAGFADGISGEGEELDLAACLKVAGSTEWFNRQPEVMDITQDPGPITTPVVLLVERPSSKTAPAASATNGDTNMSPEEKAAKEAALKEAKAQAKADEKQRRDDVRAVFTGFTSEDQTELLAICLDDMECSADAARIKLLEAVKAKDNTPTGSVQVVEEQPEKLRAAATAWLASRAQLSENGNRIRVTGDNPFRGMRLIDIARDSAERAGASVRGLNPMEIASLAVTHSTSDFPNLMQDAMHKVLLTGFNTAGDTWSAFCKKGDLSDFRPHWRHIMGSFSDLLPLGENGEVQDGTLDDTRKESITGSTKGRILNLSNQAIVNDDMSVFTDTATMMGRSAKRAVENDVYALLAQNSGLGPIMSDGKTLYHADHGNIHTGAPSVDVFDAADVILRQQTLPNENTEVLEYLDLAQAPIYLGPLGQGGNVRVINDAQYDPDTSNKLQKPNKVRGMLSNIVVTPRLTGLPWYLFADPAEVPVIEVGFVQGQDEPELVMNESFRQYGVGWRVIYNYGVAGVGWLGTLRSTGA